MSSQLLGVPLLEQVLLSVFYGSYYINYSECSFFVIFLKTNSNKLGIL